MVGAVVWVCMKELCEPRVTNMGMVYVLGEWVMEFYANDGSISWEDTEWVHWISASLVDMFEVFERARLKTNGAKTKTMILCQYYCGGDNNRWLTTKEWLGEKPHIVSGRRYISHEAYAEMGRKWGYFHPILSISMGGAIILWVHIWVWKRGSGNKWSHSPRIYLPGNYHCRDAWYDQRVQHCYGTILGGETGIFR